LFNEFIICSCSKCYKRTSASTADVAVAIPKHFNCTGNGFIPVNVKGKVVPVIPLTEHHTLKADWGSGGTVQRILELGTTPRERAPVIHWIGGWVGPRAGKT